MQLVAVVTFVGDVEHSYEVPPSTQVAIERDREMSLIDILGQRRLTDAYWMAWHAATKGRVEFDAWLADVTQIVVKVGDARPTQPAPSAG